MSNILKDMSFFSRFFTNIVPLCSILDFIAKVVEKVCKCVKDTLYGMLNQEEPTEKKHSKEWKMEARRDRVIFGKKQ